MILLIGNFSTVRIRTIITVACVAFPHYNLYITQTRYMPLLVFMRICKQIGAEFRSWWLSWQIIDRGDDDLCIQAFVLVTNIETRSCQEHHPFTTFIPLE